jgi:hypothetical protein
MPKNPALGDFVGHLGKVVTREEARLRKEAALSGIRLCGVIFDERDQQEFEELDEFNFHLRVCSKSEGHQPKHAGAVATEAEVARIQSHNDELEAKDS